MAKVSVIVPVYKVEKYLETCVKSLLGQTLTDIEIILVDDGSPDACGQMCDDFAESDPRVKVIHKENGGLSDARNAGITAATSQYIGFVDSDDYVAPDMYATLYGDISRHGADVAICGLYDCYKTKKIPQFAGNERLILDNEEALGLALEGIKFSVNAVNKLYKKSLFDEIKFPQGKLSEDAFTIPQILARARTVIFDSRPKYFYVHRGESITTSAFKAQDFNVVEAYEQNLRLVEARFPGLRRQAEFRLLWAHMYVFDKMLMSENFTDVESYKRVLAQLRWQTFKVLTNPIFSLKRKAVSLILLASPGLYARLLRRQKQKNLALHE